MKNSVRIIGVILLTAIYCIALNTASKPLIPYGYYNTEPFEQKQYYSSVSTNLFCHTSQSDSSVNSLNNLPYPNFKNTFNDLWAIVNATEHLFETEFTQYTNVSRNFLIQYRKTDIIFPFHYFW